MRGGRRCSTRVRFEYRTDAIAGKLLLQGQQCTRPVGAGLPAMSSADCNTANRVRAQLYGAYRASFMLSRSPIGARQVIKCSKFPSPTGLSSPIAHEIHVNRNYKRTLEGVTPLAKSKFEFFERWLASIKTSLMNPTVSGRGYESISESSSILAATKYPTVKKSQIKSLKASSPPDSLSTNA
ncbi:hypothetical protein D9M71_658740 [compost metagenome]